MLVGMLHLLRLCERLHVEGAVEVACPLA
jgi:hypothetical protein